MPPPAGLSTQELLRRAEGFLDKGAYKEALEDYEALLQRPLPQEIEREALYEAGQLALHEGRPKEAASYLSEYLKHNPDAQGKEEAIKKLALALMDLRDYRGAKAWLTRLGPSRDWLVHAYRYNASKGLREPRSEKIVHLVRAIALAEDAKDRRELEGLLLREFADTRVAGFSFLVEKTQDPEAKEAVFYAWLLKARQEENSSEIARCLGAWRKAGGPKVLPENILGGVAVRGVPGARLKRPSKGRARKLACFCLSRVLLHRSGLKPLEGHCSGLELWRFLVLSARILRKLFFWTPRRVRFWPSSVWRNLQTTRMRYWRLALL